MWQRAMEAAVETYRLVSLLPDEEQFGMRPQLTRAVVSVPANIAEGWVRESEKEKAQFLAIAHGSLAVVETLLTLCEQLGWMPAQETVRVRHSLDEVSRMLTVMRRHNRTTL